jgi:hypothetical protein
MCAASIPSFRYYSRTGLRAAFRALKRGHFLPILLLFSVCSLVLCLPAYGSSLWAAAGDAVRDGGALVGKNYDGQPVHCELRMVIPKQGIVYLGVFPPHGRKGQGPLAGINAKGLAVVSAAPETLSDARMSPSAERITERLLTGFETVDALLSAPHLFKKGFPVFCIIADRAKIALIEVSPHGEVAVKSTENGIIVHTNHYITDGFLSLNKKADKISELRLERLDSTLKGAAAALTVDDFINASKDKGSGAQDAIFRLDGPPGTERTLASWVLRLPKSGAPELYVALFGADGTGMEYDFNLDQPFWTEGLD